MDQTVRPAPFPIPRGAGTLHFLTMALYAGFAIPVTIIALGEFWPAGVALAVIFAVFWPKAPKHLRGDFAAHPITRVAPSVPEADVRPSGNASFDAYRSEMLDRLEKEQSRFDDFLGRLREAKDKAEFEDFMEDRARAARAATGTDDAPELREPA